MCTQGEVRAIVADMRARLEGLFPQQQIDAILFGSYARGEAEDGSDIDVMFLVDAPVSYTHLTLPTNSRV